MLFTSIFSLANGLQKNLIYLIIGTCRNKLEEEKINDKLLGFEYNYNERQKKIQPTTRDHLYASFSTQYHIYVRHASARVIYQKETNKKKHY